MKMKKTKIILAVSSLFSSVILNAEKSEDWNERLTSRKIPEIIKFYDIDEFNVFYNSLDEDYSERVYPHITGDYPSKKLLRAMYKSGIDEVFLYIDKKGFYAVEEEQEKSKEDNF